MDASEDKVLTATKAAMHAALAARDCVQVALSAAAGAHAAAAALTLAALEGADDKAAAAAARKAAHEAAAAASDVLEYAENAVRAAETAMKAGTAAQTSSAQIPVLGGPILPGAACRTFSAALDVTQSSLNAVATRPSPPPSPKEDLDWAKYMPPVADGFAIIRLSATTHFPSRLISPVAGFQWPLSQPIWPVLLLWAGAAANDVRDLVFLTDVFGSGQDVDIGALATLSLRDLDTRLNPKSALHERRHHKVSNGDKIVYEGFWTGDPDTSMVVYPIYVYPSKALCDVEGDPFFIPAPFWDARWDCPVVPSGYQSGAGQLYGRYSTEPRDEAAMDAAKHGDQEMGNAPGASSEQ
ncbi:hypothetical protein Rhopal_003327-T1 [Rhodotorula paludigena]|uniref:Uncharacterized protein n=1 Tax=Rhodotorula paludigena TaxID=86838 RepID=A0AAV5GJ92_9BASI|nr:hypothetical protein Rhopal_003327-T1 [Rhodotorula paludigena]